MACLLKELNMEPHHLMAIGDGENDVEMLQARSLLQAPYSFFGATGFAGNPPLCFSYMESLADRKFWTLSSMSTGQWQQSPKNT